jgi:phage terminase Nu1 subunit (DNA packaging protein)
MSRTASTRQGATTAQMAALWSCDDRTVQRMAQKGIAVKVGRGAYDLAASTKKYILHLREQAAGRAGTNPDVDPVAANVRLKTAQAEFTELRTKKEQAELISVEEVKSTWAGIMRTVKQFVLSLPNQIAFEVPTLTAHDRAVINRIIRDGLEDCATGRGYDAGTAQAAEQSEEDEK